MQIILFIIGQRQCSAQNLNFPSTQSVRNLREFGAEGNGSNDDTQAFRDALRQAYYQIIYIPDGTYRLTGQIVFQIGTNQRIGKGPWIYGQSRDGVILKLDDNANGFDDAAQPRALIKTTYQNTGDDLSADFFMRNVQNMTINTGNNPGAIGIQYFSNNSGALKNTRITGNGPIGLDLGWLDNNGPCYIADIEIDGYDIGIRADNVVHSQTLSRIVIKNCGSYGIYHKEQVLNIEDVIMENVPIGIYSTGGVLTVLNASLQGNDPAKFAIHHNDLGMMFLRNITATGFSFILAGEIGGDIAGEYIEEYSSNPVAKAFDNSGDRSLNLPIKWEPQVVWEQDMSKWECVDDYNPVKGDNRDDTQAFQSAFDNAAANGKTTVYINSTGDNGYNLNSIVTVHGSVEHIIGLGFVRVYGPGGFIIENTTAPLVTFRNMYSFGGTGRLYENRSSSTVSIMESDGVNVVCAGDGDVFLTDMVGTVRITNPGAHVWARQLNMESGGVNADNQGGVLWSMGSKTERNGIKYATSNGGKTEFFGACVWLNDNSDEKNTAMFTIDNAFASFASIRQIITSGCSPGSCYYERFVEETRGAETQDFRADQSYALDAMTLFAGYDPAQYSPPVPVRPAERKVQPAAAPGTTVRLHAYMQVAGPARIEVMGMNGRRLLSRDIAAGRSCRPFQALPNGAYTVRITYHGSNITTTGILAAFLPGHHASY